MQTAESIERTAHKKKLRDVSCLFWEAILEHKNVINEYLFRRNDDYKNVVMLIDKIKDRFDLRDSIGLYFSIDIRNGIQFEERKNMVELILSPIMQRGNLDLLHIMYAVYYEKYSSQTEWSVIKYKFWQPLHLESVSINYEEENVPICITHADFEYHPVVENDKISILLFIKDDLQKYLVKKETYTINEEERELWIPSNINIYTILDSAIGEYNLLNTLDKMEIYLHSEHPKIDRFPLEHLSNNVQKINNNPLSKMVKCSRCDYSNKQTTQKRCVCKKIYYCDKICQNANRKIHKYSCSKATG